jgi:uncharacterized membrane protein YeaQ/YmgE (transglycosylase-associated protein family)
MELATLVVGAAFSTTHWLVWLIIGLIAGFLATRFVKVPLPHFGIIGMIAIGLVGTFFAGLALNLLLPDTTLGFFGTIIAAFLGAVALLAIGRLVAVLMERSSAGDNSQ